MLLSLLGTFYYNEKYKGSAPGQHTSTDNPRLFNQTGFTVGGAFRQYWETHGGLAQQGYPISEEFTEIDKDGNPRTVQYFQRAVFELHPEYTAPNNVLLSLLGDSYHDKKYPAVHPPNSPTHDPTAEPGSSPTNTPVTAPTAPAAPTPPADGMGQVIFYNSTTGHAEVGHVDTSGTYYNGSHAGGTVRVNGDGSINSLKTYTNFSSGWTNIVGPSNGVYFFYEQPTGRAATLRVDSDGSVVSLQAFTIQPDWTNVVAGTNGTILFYNNIDGRAVAGKVDTNGIYYDSQVYGPSRSGSPEA